jgi:hypothetical protein
VYKKETFARLIFFPGEDEINRGEVDSPGPACRARPGILFYVLLSWHPQIIRQISQKATEAKRECGSQEPTSK